MIPSDLVTKILENAPAVVALLYLVWRQETMIRKMLESCAKMQEIVIRAVSNPE
jgi:hypothetical protein